MYDRLVAEEQETLSIADVLQRLPTKAGGLNTKFNNSSNLGNPPDGGGVDAGSVAIDLRYLGAKRTLVLVDGLRYVNGASASGMPGTVDLNSIPDVMIGRVEVLQSAASALYGSDAIGGVVNIINKSGQKGFTASARYGQFLGKDDGHTQNYQLSFGTGGSRPMSMPAFSTPSRTMLARVTGRSRNSLIPARAPASNRLVAVPA